MMCVPEKDILGNEVNVGDTVVVFSHHGISYEECLIVEKMYKDDPDDIRRALQPEKHMWMFGLGNHEMLKINTENKKKQVQNDDVCTGDGQEEFTGRNSVYQKYRNEAEKYFSGLSDKEFYRVLTGAGFHLVDSEDGEGGVVFSEIPF